MIFFSKNHIFYSKPQKNNIWDKLKLLELIFQFSSVSGRHPPQSNRRSASPAIHQSLGILLLCAELLFYIFIRMDQRICFQNGLQRYSRSSRRASWLASWLTDWLTSLVGDGIGGDFVQIIIKWCHSGTLWSLVKMTSKNWKFRERKKVNGRVVVGGWGWWHSVFTYGEAVKKWMFFFCNRGMIVKLIEWKWSPFPKWWFCRFYWCAFLIYLNY